MPVKMVFNVEAIKMLLQVLNIDVNVQDEVGYTCLMAACSQSFKILTSPIEIVQLLLDWSPNLNMDLNHQDENGQTAFIMLCSYIFFGERRMESMVE